MDYSKYYTPYSIASALINEINICSPRRIIDICCGSCNLLIAAKNKWTKSKLYGVDIAESSIPQNVSFERKDGRQFAIEHTQEFDLVVANPPFILVKNKNQFPSLFTGIFKGLFTSRLEVEMLIANLMLLQSKGILLIILPSSFVEADTYKTIRKVIANNYYIESIIKLDESTFGTSKINSYALIIHNEKYNNYSSRIGYSVENNLVFDSQIASIHLKEGNWTLDGIRDSFSLPVRKIDIKRGNVSSSSFIKKGQPVLHTSKNSTKWKPSIRYISKRIIPSVFAENGDIIVSRVGKSAGRWCIYRGDRIPISDCLFRVKDPDHSISKSLNGKCYNRQIKGVATRYITISDCCLWINSERSK